MSTAGFTSQTHGANNNVELLYFLLRTMLIAMVIGGLLILFQEPVKRIGSIRLRGK